MSNEKFDDWFDKTFDEAFDRAASSDSSLPAHDTKRESWMKVKLQLETVNRRRKRRRKYQLAGVVAASMMAGAIFFSPPTITQAVSPIYQQLKEWGDGIVTIISGKDESTSDTVAKTAPPPEGSGPEAGQIGESLLDSSDSEEGSKSLEQVTKRLSFSYPEIKYIPEGYRYDDVLAAAPADGESAINNLAVKYISEEGIMLTISMIGMSDGPVSVSSPGLDTEKVILDSGTEAILAKGRLSTLQFLYNNVWIEIAGELSKEELVKMANSLP